MVESLLQGLSSLARCLCYHKALKKCQLNPRVVYLEARGINGNAVRIDLGRGTGDSTDYPYGSIFLLADPLHRPNDARHVADPYNAAHRLSILPQLTVPLDRERYKRLIVDLIEGTDQVISNVLLLEEAYAIVQALDGIWEAIQEARPHWGEHDLGALDPV